MNELTNLLPGRVREQGKYIKLKVKKVPSVVNENERRTKRITRTRS